MSFYVIKNNDLATADIIMSNFRHLNYGNPLTPVDSAGKPVDGLITLGTSGYRWKGVYTETVNLTNHIKIHNSNFGNIYYADTAGILQPIPLGDAGQILTSTGKHTPPEWREINDKTLKIVFDTGFFTLSKENAYYKFVLPKEIDIYNTFPIFSAFSAAYPLHSREMKGDTIDKLSKVFLSNSYQKDSVYVARGHYKYDSLDFPISVDGLIWYIQEKNHMVIRKRNVFSKLGYIFEDEHPAMGDEHPAENWDNKKDVSDPLMTHIRTVHNGICRCILLEL